MLKLPIFMCLLSKRSRISTQNIYTVHYPGILQFIEKQSDFQLGFYIQLLAHMCICTDICV